MLIWVLQAGCAQPLPLEQWCHDEQLPEQPDDVACALPAADEVALTLRCGRWDVARHSSGFSGHDMYFGPDGALAAVALWDDVWRSGERIDTWYGRRVRRCEPDCYYSDDGACGDVKDRIWLAEGGEGP